MIDRLAQLPSLYVAILGITVLAGTAAAEENASNPLAAANNVDFSKRIPGFSSQSILHSY